VTGARRLSQALSEGDAISVLVDVADAASARAAQEQGAEGLALVGQASGARDATTLPILYRAGDTPHDARSAGADAWVLVAERFHDDGNELEDLYATAQGLGLECVVDVRDDEELELVLERIDPEILLLSPREADEDESPLDRVLELLPDVPAGKLVIAELLAAGRDDIAELERAGVDAVLVAAQNVADLVGTAPPEV
jgi:indole-3-glycerol phosphate synthase